jgi:serine/threonine protein kinase
MEYDAFLEGESPPKARSAPDSFSFDISKIHDPEEIQQKPQALEDFEAIEMENENSSEEAFLRPYSRKAETLEGIEEEPLGLDEIGELEEAQLLEEAEEEEEEEEEDPLSLDEIGELEEAEFLEEAEEEKEGPLGLDEIGELEEAEFLEEAEEEKEEPLGLDEIGELEEAEFLEESEESFSLEAESSLDLNDVSEVEEIIEMEPTAEELSPQEIYEVEEAMEFEEGETPIPLEEITEESMKLEQSLLGSSEEEWIVSEKNLLNLNDVSEVEDSLWIQEEKKFFDEKEIQDLAEEAELEEKEEEEEAEEAELEQSSEELEESSEKFKESSGKIKKSSAILENKNEEVSPPPSQEETRTSRSSRAMYRRCSPLYLEPTTRSSSPSFAEEGIKESLEAKEMNVPSEYALDPIESSSVPPLEKGSFLSDLSKGKASSSLEKRLLDSLNPVEFQEISSQNLTPLSLNEVQDLSSGVFSERALQQREAVEGLARQDYLEESRLFPTVLPQERPQEKRLEAEVLKAEQVEECQFEEVAVEEKDSELAKEELPLKNLYQMGFHSDESIKANLFTASNENKVASKKEIIRFTELLSPSHLITPKWFKKDILLGRILAERKLVSLTIINRFLLDIYKSETRRSLGQMLVSARHLPAEDFVMIHREVEDLFENPSYLMNLSEEYIVEWLGGPVRILIQLKDKFGPYPLICEVGSGGMGVVYKAIDSKNKRIIALKVLRNLTSEDAIARFHKEVKMTSKLNHPNIIPIYEVGELEEVPYYTMKFLEGTVLKEYKKQVSLSPRDIFKIGLKICNAVSYAHQHHILHRDIKPQNIIIDATGEPYLMDFGVAKELDSDSAMTKTDEALGTPRYMSPEQIRGDKDIDVRTDIYSLGMLFYEWINGKSPLKGESSVNMIYEILHTEIPLLRASHPEIPEAIEIIIQKAIAKDRQDRYSTVQAMAEDIQRYLKNEPIKTTIPVPTKPKEPEDKKKVLVRFFIFFFLLLNLILTCLWLFFPRST